MTIETLKSMLPPMDIPAMESSLERSEVNTKYWEQRAIAKSKINVNSNLSELDLPVYEYNIFMKAKIRTIGEAIQYSPKELHSLPGMGFRSLRMLLFHFDSHGFRFRDADKDKYPEIDDLSVADIIDEVKKQNMKKHAWNYGHKVPKKKYEDVTLHSCDKINIPGIQSNESLFYIEAKAEYQIKSCGISPQGLVIFDRSLPFSAGTLSCFTDTEGNISFSKDSIDDMEYIGKMIAVINYAA